MARSSSASLGAPRGGAVRRIGDAGRRHRPRLGVGPARQVEAARQQRFLQRRVFPLQPGDLAFEREPLVGDRLARPAGGARAALRDLAGRRIEPHKALADAMERVAAALRGGRRRSAPELAPDPGPAGPVLGRRLGLRRQPGQGSQRGRRAEWTRMGRGMVRSPERLKASLWTAIAAVARRLNPDIARACNARIRRCVSAGRRMTRNCLNPQRKRSTAQACGIS